MSPKEMEFKVSIHTDKGKQGTGQAGLRIKGPDLFLRYTTPVVIFIVSVLLLMSVYLLKTDWKGWEIATCMPGRCFNEYVHTGPVKQPINAWSSLGFYFVGLLVFSFTKRDSWQRKKPSPVFVKSPVLGYTYGSSLVVVGLGSAFFHASLTLVGQFFDVAGMYLLTAFMLVYALGRLLRWPMTRLVLLYFVTSTLLCTLLFYIPQARRWVFALVLVIALSLEFGRLHYRQPSINAKWLRIGLATFATSYILWILDNAHLLSDPKSIIQGHALWHLGGALASWFLFVYYRSEMDTVHGVGKLS